MTRICPKCGSKNVEPDTSSSNWAGEGIANSGKWVCKECDYIGPMPEK